MSLGARENGSTHRYRKSLGFSVITARHMHRLSRECQKTKTSKKMPAYHKEKCYCVNKRSRCSVDEEQADWKMILMIGSEEQERKHIICTWHRFKSNDIYLEEQGDTNITIDSLDICYDRAQDDQDETDNLDQERDLLASLIQKLKCEIDETNKNRI
ncbi:hypothetical protein Tco_0968986 [Tanacetum coccineum]